MKKVFAIALVVLVVVALALPVEAQEAYYQVGDKGFFQYRSVGNPHFTIWSNPEMAGSSGFFGEITPSTKITVVNRTISRENLDLLTGKPVVAYGTFKEVGRGEGSKTTCLSLTLFILSESDYRIPIPNPGK